MGQCHPDLEAQDLPSLWGPLPELPTHVFSGALAKSRRWTNPVFFCYVETFRHGIPECSGAVRWQ